MRTGPRRGRRTRVHRGGASPLRTAAVLLGLAVLAGAAPARSLASPGDTTSSTTSPSPAAVPQQAGCQLCHADLEFLREQAGSMEAARRLRVATPAYRASAHGEMDCAECHEGFGAFPHPEDVPGPSPCGACHADADTAWSGSAHADPEDGGRRSPAFRREGIVGPEETARCVDCHGVHDVAPVDRIEEKPGLRAMNGRCVACHAMVRIPPGAPHADTVACWSCHRPHDVRHVDTPGAAVAPRLQAGTCGTCHDSLANVWRRDVHATALMDTASATEDDGIEELPPACTDCHGAHDMVTPATHEAADTIMVERCGSCHEEYRETYLGTYHGKATAVGSRIAATCHDCHSAHEVHPASEPASWVSERRLPETCGECHGHVRPSFVAYESHPDPRDREKNPVLFYSFWFMNGLLVTVLGVFGLHTLLWWVRLALDERRGIVHEIGEDHE